MSTMTKKESRKLHANQIQEGRIQMNDEILTESYFERHPIVSTLVTTMLEIIKIKKNQNMDEETRRQFPVLAKEIIFLAEQTR